MNRRSTSISARMVSSPGMSAPSVARTVLVRSTMTPGFYLARLNSRDAPAAVTALERYISEPGAPP
jgi:hypothetical protein